MLIIEDEKYLADVVAFAKAINLYEGEGNTFLKNQLSFLDNYGGTRGHIRVRLRRDLAPYSFSLVFEKNDAGTWTTLLVGGLLYHGPLDGHGTGFAPTFAVTLESVSGWSIHT